MGFRIGTLAAGLSCAAVLWALTASAGAAEGVECGSVITEDTVLAHDLLDCENGLTVAAPDVTLDLGGHQIAGRGAGVGVVLGAEGAVVRGGSIRDFHTGVGFGRQFGSGSAETTVSHLELSSNEIGVENQASAASVRIESNTIHDNGDGLTMTSGGALIEIVDNRILDNERFGIRLLDRGNPPALVQDNLVMRNGATGIVLDTAHTIAIGNTSSRNGGDGMFIFDINCSHLNFFRLGSNLAVANQGLGIDVELPSACPPDASLWDLLDAGGNAANRNGDPRQCTIHVECAGNRGQANKLVRLDAAAGLEPHADDEGSRLAEALLRAGVG